MLLDQLERDVLAERHVAAVMMAAGAKDVTLPSMQQARAEFDAALLFEPREVARTPEEDARRQLLTDLGLR